MSQLFDRRRLARLGLKAKSLVSRVSRNKKGLKSAAYIAAGAALLGTALALGRRKKSSRSVSRRSSSKKKPSKKSSSKKKSSKKASSRKKSSSKKRTSKRRR